MPQCSPARNLPVRPSPVWISSATNSVAVAAAEILRASQIVRRRGRMTPLPWIGSTTNAATSPARQRRLERGEIVERHAHAVRQQRLEAAPEGLVAVQRERAIGQAMERVAAIGDAAAAGRARAGELDRRLDRLRAGIGEEHLVRCGTSASSRSARARQASNVHLHEVRQIGIEHAFQRGTNRRMIAAEREHTESAQQVEIAVIVPVVEVLAASLAKADVIADRPQDADHLLVETPGMQAKALGFVGFEQCRDVDISS